MIVCADYARDGVNVFQRLNSLGTMDGAGQEILLGENHGWFSLLSKFIEEKSLLRYRAGCKKADGKKADGLQRNMQPVLGMGVC